MARVCNPWPRYAAAPFQAGRSVSKLGDCAGTNERCALADLAGIPANVLENQDHGLKSPATGDFCRGRHGTRRYRLLGSNMKAFVDYDLPGLRAELSAAGLVPLHAERLLREFYRSGGSPDWSRAGAGARVEAWVRRELLSRRSRIQTKIGSADGTTKLLIEMLDGAVVESVLMPGYRADRAAACVSSQIGCAMGCDFCASTKGGLERDLEAGEIVEQFLHSKSEAAALGRRLTSLVFMGMGEPMHNLDNVIAAIRRITDPAMGALGWRQVTVSTVGIVPGIDRLSEAGLNVHLALSLHAADDEVRSRLVPANRRYPVAQIMAAVRRFADRTGRVPTIEYCMLADVNDSDDQARTLAALLDGFRVHVNLIPYNPIGAGLSGKSYERPAAHRMEAFISTLRDKGVVAHFRDTRGDEINAACGQLRVMVTGTGSAGQKMQIAYLKRLTR